MPIRTIGGVRFLISSIFWDQESRSGNFHDPGYMKHHKNQMLHFHLFSWPYMKLHKNQMLHFPPIIMTPGKQKSQMLKFSSIFMTVNETSKKSYATIFSNFHGTWNFKKIRCFIFLQLSWPWVNKTSQKSEASFFSNSK